MYEYKGRRNDSVTETRCSYDYTGEHHGKVHIVYAKDSQSVFRGTISKVMI